MYSIELDCPPGGIRPGDLLPGVLEGTGIVLGEPDSKFFGEWAWSIPADQAEQYAKVQPKIQARITELYNRGYIRYGSW